MRQRVGMVIASTLFVAACAAVSSSTPDQAGVLSAVASRTSITADSVDDAGSGVDPPPTSRPPRPVAPSPGSVADTANEAPGSGEAPSHLGGVPDEAPPPRLAIAALLPPTTAAPPPPTTAAPPPPTTAAPPPPTTAASPPPTVAPPPTTTVAPTRDPGAEASFVAEINALRASVGAGSLTRSGDLDARAQAWADQMAADGSLRHSTIIDDLVAGSWHTAGENVAYGPSVGSIFDSLRDTPGHYANMIDGAFTQVGVGVAVINGTIWTTHLLAG